MSNIDITKSKTELTIIYGEVVEIKEGRLGGKRGFTISVKTNNKRIHKLTKMGELPANIKEGSKTGFVVEPKVRVDKEFVKVDKAVVPSGKWLSPLYKVDRNRVEYLNIIHTSNSISLM
jgi:hypothetical protein